LPHERNNNASQKKTLEDLFHETPKDIFFAEKKIPRDEDGQSLSELAQAAVNYRAAAEWGVVSGAIRRHRGKSWNDFRRSNF
jgi:hypothetical protein